MVPLWIGVLRRILVDLADLPVDFSVDFLVRVWLDCLPVGFWLVCRSWLVDFSVDFSVDFMVGVLVDCLHVGF